MNVTEIQRFVRGRLLRETIVLSLRQRRRVRQRGNGLARRRREGHQRQPSEASSVMVDGTASHG